MIEMISDLLKEAKGDIITLTDWIKNIVIIGKTIIEIKNVPAMEKINNLKEMVFEIAAGLAVIWILIRNKVKRH